jgi:hypothetical protein
MEKVAMMSFLLVFIFPHHSNFFSPLIFQLNCYSVGRAGRPPSLNQGNNGPPLPSTPACRVKAVKVSFPLVFIFSPPSKFCLIIFSVKLLFSRLHWLHSLPQSRVLGPATTISAHLLHGEGDDGEFSSCFYFFSTIPIYFSQPLFPVKLLFNGSHVLLIFIFIPCPSSQF